MNLNRSGNSPIKVLSIAFCLTIVILAVISLVVWNSFKDLENIEENKLRVDELTHNITYFDEVLTVSAKMATATGDLSWEARYRSFEPILDSDIKEVSRIPLNGDFNETANRVNIANLKLVEMENRAFDLVRAGRKEEGKAILESKEYQIQEQIYHEGLKEIISKSRGHEEAVYSQQRQRVSIVIVAIIASILILIFSWFVVITTIRRYIEQNKKAEATLQESEEKYRNLVERSNDGILIIQDGLVKFGNACLEKLWGGSVEELLDTPTIRHIHPDEREKVMEHYQRRMANENVPQIYETVLLRKDGTTGQVEINAGVISYKGKPADLIMVRDITERKLAEEELKKYREHLEKLVDERTCEMKLTKEEAEHANMAKTNFLQTMSHELRTPLNAVLGFSEMLKLGTSGELNEKQERFIDNIITGGNNLHNIISQILEVVKLEEGTLELHIETIPVPETVDKAIGIIKECAAKKNVLVEKNLDPELEYIEADKQKFKQVFINLLDNAVKFSKDEGGTITITAKKEGDMARFSVSDTGIGITEDDAGKLFQKFTQLDSGTSRKYGGTGIGLAITKQFVELHGGRIWVESKYREGSTFIFTLPLKSYSQVFQI